MTKKTYSEAVDLLNLGGANIDAHYGPWSTVSEYEDWADTKMKSIPNGVTIAIEDSTTGVITKYHRENSDWVEEGYGEVDFGNDDDLLSTLVDDNSSSESQQTGNYAPRKKVASNDDSYGYAKGYVTVSLGLYTESGITYTVIKAVLSKDAGSYAQIYYPANTSIGKAYIVVNGVQREMVLSVPTALCSTSTPDADGVAGANTFLCKIGEGALIVASAVIESASVFKERNWKVSADSEDVISLMS